jgi:hypothetical protein
MCWLLPHVASSSSIRMHTAQSAQVLQDGEAVLTTAPSSARQPIKGGTCLTVAVGCSSTSPDSQHDGDPAHLLIELSYTHIPYILEVTDSHTAPAPAAAAAAQRHTQHVCARCKPHSSGVWCILAIVMLYLEERCDYAGCKGKQAHIHT